MLGTSFNLLYSLVMSNLSLGGAYVLELMILCHPED